MISSTDVQYLHELTLMIAFILLLNGSTHVKRAIGIAESPIRSFRRGFLISVLDSNTKTLFCMLRMGRLDHG